MRCKHLHEYIFFLGESRLFSISTFDCKKSPSETQQSRLDVTVTYEYANVFNSRRYRWSHLLVIGVIVAVSHIDKTLSALHQTDLNERARERRVVRRFKLHGD